MQCNLYATDNPYKVKKDTHLKRSLTRMSSNMFDIEGTTGKLAVTMLARYSRTFLAVPFSLALKSKYKKCNILILNIKRYILIYVV